MFNKIIYYMKVVPVKQKWMDKLMDLYRLLTKTILIGTNYNKLMDYQSQLSQKKGGFGLRQPDNYHFAAKLSADGDKEDKIRRFFLFLDMDNDNNIKWYNTHNYDQYMQLYQNELIKHTDHMNQLIDGYNHVIEPYYSYIPTQHKKHKDLIDTMDKYMLSKIYELGNEYDKARIKSIQTNGACSWMNIPYNNIYSIKFDNLSLQVLSNLIMGSKQNFKDNHCNRCHKHMDQHGYHALSCPNGALTIIRHNKVRDVIFDYCIKAGYNATKEERYKMDEIDMKWKQVEGVPGDIKIENYNLNGRNETVYFDVTIGNIFDDSYIKNTSKERGWLNNFKEKQKSDKYQNVHNVIGLAMEVTGAISPNLKALIMQISKRLETTTNVHFTTLINRIRSQIIATLMQENAKMIYKSFY